ncbi:hypothetical protein [uncultured Dokdonia sp.]|uniref:hypothetical protein n=1 Tax=uncultured Dokdonia sp. TaxID=575653 RepID=UPI00260D2B84|nr:hypothetical protein [uncultured Dokdonia sp.]
METYKGNTNLKDTQGITSIITTLNAELVAKKQNQLNDLEIAVLEAAYTNLSGPEDKRGAIDDFTPYGALEKSGPRFALDAKAFQIIRREDPSQAVYKSSWVRFGVEVDTIDGEEKINGFLRSNMYEYKDQSVNVSIDMPDTAFHLNRLMDEGLPVVAFLGAARLGIVDGMLLLEYVQNVVDTIPNMAVMTGGYRGEEGNSYGVTRAGFDVPKSRSMETLVVMCEAGVGHAHQTSTSKTIYGKHWGDDTPGLVATSDVAIFIRNVPAGKNFGAWTEVEIANFLYHNKGVAILDPTLSETDFPTGETEEVFFEKKIRVFRDPIALAHYIKTVLPCRETLQNRTPFTPNEEAVEKAIYQRYIDHDMVKEDWLGVRLHYGPISDEEREELDALMTDEERESKKYSRRARWVRNERISFLKYDEAEKTKLPEAERQNYIPVFPFSNLPEAIEAGSRDLILSGYWKDIMLLQILKKIKVEDITTSEMIEQYATYRKVINDRLQKELLIGSVESILLSKGTIAGIWLLYKVEHTPNMLSWLIDIVPNDYDKALQALSL